MAVCAKNEETNVQGPQRRRERMQTNVEREGRRGNCYKRKAVREEGCVARQGNLDLRKRGLQEGRNASRREWVRWQRSGYISQQAGLKTEKE